MGISIGIDAGTVSLKIALAGEAGRLEDIQRSHGGLIERVRTHGANPGMAFAISKYIRIQGRPLETVSDFLKIIVDMIGPGDIDSAVVTGAASKLVSKALGIPQENEFRAAATGVGELYPNVVNVFEMGGENSKYIRVGDNGNAGAILDFETNGDCAAGTGSFMDQQACRLCFAIEETGDIASSTGRSPKIAGRCSVFAKSDMIHAQQKGFMPEEVLKGLCEAVARNFKSNIAKGRKISGRTAFIGGVALNRGVADALRNSFGLNEEDFFIPDDCAYMGAIGSAVLAGSNGNGFDPHTLRERLGTGGSREKKRFPSWEPLSMEGVVFLRDSVSNYSFKGRTLPVKAWLGIDIGSVSTNLALIDDEGSVIYEIYLRTKARPIEVVGEGLRRLETVCGGRIRIAGVGTTGSGRELIGELVGADTVNDEITAHKTGASFISKRYTGRNVDTIFEIGGQDSKFISIDDGVVIDFAMNEACAAGTGSFLEEQAEKLDIRIVEEFSKIAFTSKAPLRLGERCTVYMEQDISYVLKEGAGREDLVAGLAYSVVQNYLNRVVRGRRIGETVFFQGGTAYNDSVAAAFSRILGRKIIVPPHNGVIGAIGAALLSREKINGLGAATIFRGFDLSKIDFSMREFSCNGCANFCDIQEFTVMGERTYWGDKCSSRFRKRAKIPSKPVTGDLIRLYGKLLERDYTSDAEERTGRKIDRSPPKGRPALTAGIPKAMYYFDRYPFWSTWLRAMGIEVVTGPGTNREILNTGVEETVAEPCLPVQVAHGHIAALLGSDPDLILVPNTIDTETESEESGSYLCPWGQTLPFVVKGMPSLAGREDLIVSPTVHFRESEKYVESELWAAAGKFGVSRRRHRLAVRAAFAAQDIFREKVLDAGKAALKKLEETGDTGIILAGRPYNIMDGEINLGVPEKLRSYYGVNVIPLFFLPLEGVDLPGSGTAMFWSYGRKILQAAALSDSRENLHLIYITNFKCGPDSYIKHFCNKASPSPWLALQFDAHGNDAGMMTRCEAYLDSKGVLRWWKKKSVPSGGELCTSPECPPEAPKLSRQRSGTWG